MQCPSAVRLLNGCTGPLLLVYPLTLGCWKIAAWTIFFFCLLLPMVPVIATLYYPEFMVKGFKLATGVLVILAQVVMVARYAEAVSLQLLFAIAVHVLVTLYSLPTLCCCFQPAGL